MQGDIGRIPVTLVTGFLGSGKTSLLNRLLRDPQFRDSAVLVNELGEIGIDHLLIAAARDRVVLLGAGCLCCAISDSLRETLADLYQRRGQGDVPAFQRVLIETSGLADPGPILQMLLKDPLIAPLFLFSGVICVVDALHAESQLRESVEAREQVALADRLVVSKLDACAGGVPASLQSELQTLNPGSPIVPIPAADQSVVPLFEGLDAQAPRLARSHPQHSSGIVSASFRFEPAASWAGIAAWSGHLVERYGVDLLRCKALLRLEGRSGRVVVQGVRKLFAIHHDAGLDSGESSSIIVLIGRQLERSDLQAGLAWLQAPKDLQQPASAGFAPWRNELRAAVLTNTVGVA